MILNRVATLGCVLFSMTVVTGCGPGSGDRPELGDVSGVVTLDGNPVGNARVTFQPTEGGRSSFANTDADGGYRLKYTEDYGAKVGEHEVSISTWREATSEDSGDGDESADAEDHSELGRAELIPKKYNTMSDLRRTVESGSQTIDFELEDVPGEKKRPAPRGGHVDDDDDGDDD